MGETVFSNNRRRFMINALNGAFGLSLAGYSCAPKNKTNNPDIRNIRKRTLGYIESMRINGEPYGRYKYSAEMTEPTLYSSTYAAMTRHLYRDIETLTEIQRKQWIDYIQSFQDDDGLYRDPAIYGEGWYKDDPEWCGRRHLTCHVVTALACLGKSAKKPMTFLDPFLEPGALEKWLESRDWVKNVDYVGNEVLNLGTLLQYARDFQNNVKCSAAINTMFNWMNTHFINPETGLWGELDLSNPKGLSRAVQAAYHFWLLYFYDNKPIPYADKALSNILKTQNPAGGFGQGVHNPENPLNSSACEDIDSIDPLARLIRQGEKNNDKIKSAINMGLTQVLKNLNPDGGYVFMRDKEFEYGHPKLYSGKNVSAMFPTWFRTLTIAYIGKALPDSEVGSFDWQFCNCPGLQFWKG